MKKLNSVGFALGAGLLLGGFAFTAEAARTVGIAEKTDTAVTVAFGATDGLDYELYVASGAADGGDDKYAWDSFTRVGAVAYDQDTFVYEVPAALRNGAPLRFFLMQTQGLPIAQELEAVKSTGEQWVTTGYKPSNRTEVDFSFSGVTYANQTAFFGQQWAGSRYLLNQQSNKFMFHGGGNLSFTLTPNATTAYRCRIIDNNTLVLDANDKTYTSSISRTVSSANLAVFGASTGDHRAAFAFHGMKIAEQGVLKRNFVPAADANGVAGLYDQVENVFYKSQTATALVAGAARPAARFGRVVDTTSSFVFRRALAVTARTADTVTLAFGNPDGAAYQLYLGAGATDGADAKTAWESFDLLGTVAADATTGTYSLPAAAKAAGARYRFFLMKTEDLPYAKEVASLTSTGAQCVPLGTIAGTKTVVDFRFGDIKYVNSTAFFGTYWNSYCYLLNQQSNKFMFHAQGNNLDGAVVAGVDYRCRVMDDNTLELSHGGVRNFYSNQLRGSSVMTPFTVFSCYDGSRASTFRFDAMTVKENGLPVHDLVPVVTAAGKGALFDRVSGRCFANVKETDFTKGAELARTGWVVATTASFAALASDAPIKATWTGAGDRANAADPANWACVDGTGAALANAIPGAGTEVVVGETTNFNLPAGSTLTYGTITFPSQVKLTADCDWSGLADWSAAPAAIDLGGHTLTVTSSAALATVKTAPTLTGGTLRLVVPAGVTAENADLDLGTDASLVKAGYGTLKLVRAMASLASLTIEEGLVAAGRASLFPKGTPLEIQAGAAFDFAGYPDSPALITLAGEGPDGKGALRNTGAAGTLPAGSAQLAGLKLAGDATIMTTAGSLGLINPSYGATTLELNGHTLTVNVATGAGFWLANTSGTTAGTIVVKNGVIYPYNKSYAVNLPNVDVVVDGANSIFRISTTDSASKTTMRNVTLLNGATYEEGNNSAYYQNFFVGDNCLVPNKAVKWIYLANTLTVSNETSDVSIYPPFTSNGTYPRIVKQGAGTLNILNNHSDQRFDGGLDLQGGTFVMGSTASTKNYHVAISSQPVPVAIHAGATLDMTACTQPVKLSALTVEPGGTIRHTAAQTLAFPNGATFAGFEPFAFTGTVNLEGTVTFNLANAELPAPGTSKTLLAAGKITGGAHVVVKGCPADYEVSVGETAITLYVRTAEQSAKAPIKISTLGGTYAYVIPNENNVTVGFQSELARSLEADGWNIEMTGWRNGAVRYPNGAYVDRTAWQGFGGVQDLALKTSATRAGVLEGLEAYCLGAKDPDFLVFICGDTDVADGVAEDTIFANWTLAVDRIKAALPMTTVLASTIPGASAALNERLAAWANAQADVVAVDLASCYAAGTVAAQQTAAAAALKAAIQTLATADGKKTPSTYTRPAVELGAAANVPAEYLAGFTHAATLDVGASVRYTQDLNAVPYSYLPLLPQTGIVKAGYFVELVRADTGAAQMLWIDMDAPGSTWADVSLPVTHAQRKQQAVTKLHVWSNSRAVSTVAPTDDSVAGYIEFNCVNYSGPEVSVAGAIAEPWTSAFGFNDTLTTSGTSGHGSFQFMRAFAEADAFPAGEVLFTLTHWGASSAGEPGLGIGTLANYGKHGWTGDKDLDRTFCYGAGAGELSATKLAVRRIEFWVKYDGTAVAPSRADAATAAWTGATDAAFATAGNWADASGTAATTLASATVRVPDGKDVAFTYVGYDPTSLASTTLLLDGTGRFADVGGLYLRALDMDATGRLVIDPVKFALRLTRAPVFAAGAKIALTDNYAANTKGRFLLMTWDTGALDLDAAALTALFDTASAAGTAVQVTAENFATGGGRLWLELAAGTAKERLNILCVGDSITQGSDGSYGNWRTLLMKYLAAAGYEPWAKGLWTIESHDICGATLPEEWTHHAGISAQCLITKNRGGTLDAIEAMLDQAGDLDFVLVKLGTNDINGDNSTVDNLGPAWTELVNKILVQKPHAKFVAGAVVDIAYDATKDARVQAFNAFMKKAIEEDAIFPAKRTAFADLYTPCYRYDAEKNYITGSFLTATNLHPDWPGEYKMACVYGAAIERMRAEDPAWQPNAPETDVPTASGAEANVPEAYRAGLVRARVLDLAKYSGANLADLGCVPYETAAGSTAATENLARVGYYIELKRKNTAASDYHGLVRYLWVSMDAFGSCNLAEVGVPLTAWNQTVVRRLRVKTNMPGLADTTAEQDDQTGWVEFWPSSYTEPASGLETAPAHTYGYDWSDTRADNMAGYGSMQVHLFTPGKRNPAQVLFAFNRWTSTGSWEIGLGNFSNIRDGSVDWTFTGDAGRKMTETMSADAYEVARLEIWTSSAETDKQPALVTLDAVSTVGTTTTVDGSLTSFGTDATGATVKLEWSADEDFATVAGTVELGEIAALGAVTANVENLAAGTVWHFRFVTTNSAGTSGTSMVRDYEVVYDLWRPQTAADTWNSLAWLRNGVGAPEAFTPGWQAVFDGAETVKPAAVQIPGTVEAAQVLVQGAGDYTFTGAGSITAQKLVKDGAGRLTLEQSVLAGTPDLEIRAGVVKLGDNAVTGAAGSNGGTVTVQKGGQFDFNYNATTAGAGQPRALVTSGKKFVIAGDGPNGEGALVTTKASTVWGSPINEVILTDDATIGGVGRIDVRGNAKNSITGPDDKTLTVKLHTSNAALGLNVHGPVSVGKLAIASEGAVTLEGTAFSLNLPLGLDLEGTLSLWNANGTWNVPAVNVGGTTATVYAPSGTGYVKAPVNVPAAAKLTLAGSATATFEKPLTSAGEIATTGGAHNFLDAVTLEEGARFTETAGNLYWKGPSVTGAATGALSGGMWWMSGATDWSQASLDVTLSGSAQFVLGINNDGYGLPNIKGENLKLTAADGNNAKVFFHASQSDAFDNLTVGGTINNFYSQGPTTAAVEVAAANLKVRANAFNVGTSSGRSELTVSGAASEIHAKQLLIDTVSDDQMRGLVTVTDGLFALGANGIFTNMRQPSFAQFTMANGTLRADDNFALMSPGLTAAFGTPVKGGEVTLDLNGKTVKWQTGLTGASDVKIVGDGTFTSVRPGIQGVPTGKWTVESTGSIDLRNASGFAGGLELAANTQATLGIEGTNAVELQVWTWSGNAWDVMKPRFTSGRATAQHLCSSLRFVNRPASAITGTKSRSGFGANFMGEFYVSAEQAGTWWFASNGQTHNGLQIDGTELSRYGKNVGGFSSLTLAEGWHTFMASIYADANNPTIGMPTNLTAAQQANEFWFKVGGSTNGSWPEDYQPFDTTALPMRPRSAVGARTSVRWRKALTGGQSGALLYTADESIYATFDVATNSLQVLNQMYKLGYNSPLGGSCNRFDGYFHVKASEAGSWTFTGKFDDFIAVEIDGRRLFETASCAQSAANITLTPGWHAFTILTADNSTATNNGAGGLLTDADGNTGVALTFAINGGAARAFDERNLSLALAPGDAQKIEALGLGGTVTLGAGSVLSNDVRAGYCPIYGTLAGSGTLSGPFRFTGDTATWAVKAKVGTRQAEAAAFANADAETLAGLKNLSVTFDRKPGGALYELADQAYGLTAETLADVALTVTDADGNDYSDVCSLGLAGGKLVLRNSRVSQALILVR